MKKELVKISYFPGCSLATSAKENNISLIKFCKSIGYELIELEDWNCCGSSSAHSIDSKTAFGLASRNLFLAPFDRPLLAACPSCILRLLQTHLHISQNIDLQNEYEKMFSKPFNRDLKIIHFFEILANINLPNFIESQGQNKKEKLPLDCIKFLPYYGCMLARPPEMKNMPNYHGLIEKILSSLGAEVVRWSYSSRCCGTFLSVSRPEIVTPIINDIMLQAVASGADCIVTACAMCHLNMEIRCSIKNPIPTLHFSEILSLAMGIKDYKGWFERHIVDPVPMLKQKGLI
ncbi:MAG: hypothetical protein HQK68_09755 [Desulfamplus sp.]|nr:hypothetical protein [Desulfamplus sp.]